MWYFIWLLGVLLACVLAIVVLLWLENHNDRPLDPL
ncbi:MAG: cytochrome bd-I oxidase subunit CydX [Candidatus Symbiodolus clandestinus]